MLYVYNPNHSGYEGIKNKKCEQPDHKYFETEVVRPLLKQTNSQPITTPKFPPIPAIPSLAKTHSQTKPTAAKKVGKMTSASAQTKSFLEEAKKRKK